MKGKVANNLSLNIFYLLLAFVSFIEIISEENNSTQTNAQNNKQFYQVPKYYANITYEKPLNYYDYENLEINNITSLGNIDDYNFIRKIGSGKYSIVYEGINTKTSEIIVLKILKPIKTKRLIREILILKNLQGGPNVINLYDVLIDPNSNIPVLVFENISNIQFKIFYPTLTDLDIRYYMYQVFQTLDYANSQGIMHRDIKPQNIMIDSKKKKLTLIDWGLAEFYFPGREYNVKVSSRYFKGPEILLNYTLYDYSHDMWSVGCWMAGIIFKRHYFIKGVDNNDQLLKIVQILGSEELEFFIAKYNISVRSKTFLDKLRGYPKRPLQSFVNKFNSKMVDDDAIDLLSKLLVFDHSKRILPKDAMLHPYFDKIK